MSRILTCSSLGTLTTDEFIELSSDESNRPLLVAFVSPSCKNCEEHYYPLIQALHAFRGTDVRFLACLLTQMVVATMNTADVEGHLGDCDINMEAELPEFRFYKPRTGICLECPDKQFNVLVCSFLSSLAGMGRSRAQSEDASLAMDGTDRQDVL